MNVISRKKLRAFWEDYGSSEESLRAWYLMADKAEWGNAAEVVSAFPKVSVLKDNRFAFNIKGNDYRLIVKIHFRTKVVFIRWVGTHAEYDKINANEV